LLALCSLSLACGDGIVNWRGQGGSAGTAAPTAGTGGAAGTTDPGVGGGGSGGTGGSGGAPSADCPDDGRDTAGLTLVGLGIPPEAAALTLADAGTTPDGGAPDAGPRDAGAAAPAPVILPGLEGWAAVSGLGLGSTLGGAAGRVVTARTSAELESYAQSSEPLVIRVCGTIGSAALQVSSDKTLIGVGAGATLEGGLLIRGTPEAFVRNVVVKNLRINAATSNAEGAAIQVYNAHHVWIDHSELFDAANNLLQVVHGSDFVSVSWTKFHFTPDTPDQKHRFGCLIGDRDESAAEDADHLRVTLHHNWWADDIRQRAPRVRFGDVHVYNNYWSSAGNDWSIWAAIGSRVLLENNYFHGVNSPFELHDPDAQLLSSGNVFDGATGSMQSTGSAFTPPYPYELGYATLVKDAVLQGAGVR
jgi:pectate lyase